MIVLLTGVSGSGKSTIGSLLAERLHCPFEDGDALHPPANIAKMRAGIPLTDTDRWPWLQAVAGWIDTSLGSGQPAVVACSALKRSYRDLLREGRPQVRFVLLSASREVLAARLAARHGHFFRASLLDSQLAALEPPAPGEGVLTVSATGAPAEVTAEIIRGLGLAAGPSASP